jgi:hypothetical protein
MASNIPIQILFSLNTEVPPFLYPGQLAYSYKSNTLFIGAGTPENGSNVAIPLAYGGGLLIDHIDPIDVHHVPNSKVIYEQIKSKLDTIDWYANNNRLVIRDEGIDTITQLTEFAADVIDITIDEGSGLDLIVNNQRSVKVSLQNIFNKFKINNNLVILPQIKLDSFNIESDENYILINGEVNENKISFTVNVKDNLTKDEFENTTNNSLIPTISSTKTYIDYRILKLADEIKNGLTLQRYFFNSPTIAPLINHNRNTDLFDVSIRNIENNRQIIAPFEIIDENNFVILFTEEESCIIDVRF